MMIKLTELNDNIVDINSDMIVYYTSTNIRQIREGKDDVIQEATRIVVVGNENIYVKENPDYIRMLLNTTDINKQNIHQELKKEENNLKTYRVRYADMMTGRFFVDIPDIEAHSIEEAVILCKIYIKEHKTDTNIFFNLFNGIDYNTITILDENDDRHQIKLFKRDL